jgi:hypothetical protein
MTIVYQQGILFIVMFFSALFLNPMNILAYQIDHLYPSLTLIYASLYMASTMICTHQIVHYFQMGHFNITVFGIGLFMMLFFIWVLRNQYGITSQQWLRRMIPHHSTALTTTKKLLENEKMDDKTFRLAKNIVMTQQQEIYLMKSILNVVQ